MSFDIPQMHFADNSDEAKVLEAIIKQEHVTVEEAILRAVRAVAVKQPKARMAANAKPKASNTDLITDAEVAAFEKAFPALSLLDDVTDEQWSRISSRIRRMKRAGLSTHA